jgi:hypothetical protein
MPATSTWRANWPTAESASISGWQRLVCAA